MYRQILKRTVSLIPSHSHPSNTTFHRQLPRIISSSFSTTSPPPSLQHPPPQTLPDPETLSEPSKATVESVSAASLGAEPQAEEASSRSYAHESAKREQRKRTVEFQDEQVLLLQAALPHVIRLGWSEAAMIQGAKQVGLSPSIVGAIPRKEAALVEFFMDDCLQRLIDRINPEEDLKILIPSERVAKLVRIRLEMQAPYITKWPQALSIQAQPMNIPTSFKQRAMLVDEIWHASGDQASDIDWYMKRTVLGGIYSATEIYMLTDNSPDFRDTWAFLNNRVKDAFDVGKTVKEATYLAEAVGAGIGSTLQGFMKGMSQR